MTTNDLNIAVAKLQSENSDVRIQTIKWLAHQQSPTVVDLLLQIAATDEVFEVANEAEITLHELSKLSEHKEYFLVKLMEEIPLDQKEIIAKILQDYKDQKVVNSLLTLSEHFPENLRLRESAVSSLILYDRNRAKEYCRKAKINILVAEDEKDILDLVIFTLRYAGWSVLGANNGEVAYTYADVCRPELILLDVRMPKMTGYDACRLIKNNPDIKHIPVVFLSAKALEHEIQLGIDAGADDYILKPFFPDQLVERIKDVMRKAHLGVYNRDTYS